MAAVSISAGPGRKFSLLSGTNLSGKQKVRHADDNRHPGELRERCSGSRLEFILSLVEGRNDDKTNRVRVDFIAIPRLRPDGIDVEVI